MCKNDPSHEHDENDSRHRTLECFFFFTFVIPKGSIKPFSKGQKLMQWCFARVYVQGEVASGPF